MSGNCLASNISVLWDLAKFSYEIKERTDFYELPPHAVLTANILQHQGNHLPFLARKADEVHVTEIKKFNFTNDHAPKYLLM